MVNTQQLSNRDLHGCSEKQETQTLVQPTSRSSGGRCRQEHRDGSVPGWELHWKNNYTIDPRAASTSAPWSPDSRASEGEKSRFAGSGKRLRRARAPALGEVRRLPIPAGLRGGCLAAEYSRPAAATKWPARRHVRIEVSARASFSSYLAEFPQINRSSIKTNGESHEDQCAERKSVRAPGSLQHDRAQPPVAIERVPLPGLTPGQRRCER